MAYEHFWIAAICNIQPTVKFKKTLVSYFQSQNYNDETK